MQQKAVVFTESKRTQKFIAAELRKDGYSEEDILLFNGDFNDTMTKEIYRAWQVKNFGKVNYGRGVEYKHAIVDYFKEHARILIVTDAGSEGLNLQFCNTVINYDLPWNPQKIEQRIGRCHRYGQEHDVVAINLLNTDNEADKRVYDILKRKFELFNGVFGASDVALGALESGISFEKMILDIYQNCDSETEFRNAFENLNRQLDARRNKQITKLRSLLLTESPESKGESLEKTKRDIDQYLADVEYWNRFEEPEIEGGQNFWRIDNWGEKNFGFHGTLFIGAFFNGSSFLFPVLLLCDENGNHIDIEEHDLVAALENADDIDIRYFKPTDEELDFYRKIYDCLISEMAGQYNRSVAPVKEYNRQKIDNWEAIQLEQLAFQEQELNKEIETLFEREALARDPLEKADIFKEVVEKKKALDKFREGLSKKVSGIRTEAKKEIDDFNAGMEIEPLLLINIVLKF